MISLLAQLYKLKYNFSSSLLVVDHDQNPTSSDEHYIKY